jgi:hypothetical protein
MSMSVSELNQIGDTLYGANTRWGRRFADEAGFSPAQMSKIRKGIIQKISPKIEQRVRALLQQRTGSAYLNQGNDTPAPEGSVEHSFAGTEVEGGAHFKLKLVAQDVLSKKFVAVRDVDPRFFFEAYAPQQQVVVQQAPVGRGRPQQAPSSDDAMSDDEILARVGKRFRVAERVARNVLEGDVPSMILYGPSGLGKSHSIMAALDEKKAGDAEFNYSVIKGSVSAVGLYKALYELREGGVLLLDDADNAFENEETLNILKAALDSSDERRMSWAKESSWLSDLGPDAADFIFNGSVIFITNVNLKDRKENGHRYGAHYDALISRSLFIDLSMNSTRSKALRIKQVLEGGMGADMGLTEEQISEVVEFMNENRDRLNEVNLHMAKIVLRTMRAEPETWRETIEVTKMSF